MNGVPATVCFVLAALGATTPAVTGTGANGWSPRQRLPGIHDDAFTPSLLADRNHTVHAFHSQPARTDASQLAIVYSQWTLRGGWTLPTDIVLPPMRKQASILDALLDGQGVMHIVFFSGDDAVANLYYSRAWATNAGTSRAWSPPELIGPTAIVPRTAALARDEQGTLTAVYSGNRQGVGLYTTRSTDGGATWSEAVALFRVDRGDLQQWAALDLRAWNPKIARDHNGRLHLTWVVVGRDGNGKAIYYAGLDTASHQWTAPLLLDSVGPTDYEVDWPSIAAYHDDLLLIYDNHSPPERMLRTSKDAGRTWSEAVQVLAPTVGEYGNAAFAVDAGDTLHVVFGDRARGLNLWHSVWDGEWRQPESIAPETDADTYRSGPEEFHPSRPRLVVSQGNVLLAVWTTDPGRSHNGTWSAYKVLGVPQWPTEPLPPAPSRLPSTPILFGTLFAALLVGIGASRKYWRGARWSGATQWSFAKRRAV